MYSPGACAHWVGIYFPARHVLLFVKSKKKSRPQHVLTECLCSRSKHVLLFGMRKQIQTLACTHRVLVLSG